MVRNDKVVDTQDDERFLSDIKTELISMEEFRIHPRGKGLGRKVYVGRQSTGAINRG